MNTSTLYPCGRVSRRGFLHQAGGGFLGVALGGLWAEAGTIPDAALGPHVSPRAKSVIFLFMCGGVSHIDTFDPKDNKWAGKLIDVVGFGDNNAPMKRPVIRCERTFTRFGKSGIPVSDWFPHVGSVIDDVAVVRSMWCNEGNHFPAVFGTCTGHRGRQFDHPTLGAWVSYALGRQVRLARRLAERSVRVVQVCHAGGGNGSWDAHGNINTHAPLCRATDRPIAGLIKDLKQRGMLDETLVVWTSEFGRSPWSQ